LKRLGIDHLSGEGLRGGAQMDKCHQTNNNTMFHVAERYKVVIGTIQWGNSERRDGSPHSPPCAGITLIRFDGFFSAGVQELIFKNAWHPGNLQQQLSESC
jgi:hypothetical protein